MSETGNTALLPTGLRDLLPPDAAFEAWAIERLMGTFAGHGYERVKPPLIEFETSLLAGPGAALSSQMFRVVDPISQRVMGVRPDQTLQVARMATSRLVNRPRPLRLSYAGQVLRVKGSQLRPERQFAQAGLELIGSAAASADAEVILLATEAAVALGAEEVTVDLTIPTLVPALFDDLGLDADARERCATALAHKDAAAVADVDGTALLTALVEATGTLERAAERLRAIDLPPKAAAERGRLLEVAGLIRADAPDLRITVDPVESRGFEYHTGVTCVLFAPGVSGELGRGGRYLAGETGEEATGVTLYLDTLLSVLPHPEEPFKLLLPHGTGRAARGKLRTEGWTVVSALEPVGDLEAEARRLGCTHVLTDGTPTRL